MKKNLKYIIPITFVVIVLVVVRTMTGNSTADVHHQNAPLVTTERPHQETVYYTLRFTGDVLPIQQANIYSKVNGNLERIYVDIGTTVRKNQLLALIDTTELAQQYQQASATYLNARVSYNRVKELAERSLVSKQDLDNAETSMKVAQAAFETAQTRLGYARITAPFSGIVTKRYLDPGALVTSNNSTLYTLMDLDAVKIIVSVLEKDIPSISIGKKATVTVDAFPEKEFSGSITRVSEAVDLSTRTMAVEIDIENRDHILKPGMFANITLVVNEHPNSLTLATAALLRDDTGYYVYAVNGSTAHRKDVSIGIEQNSRTEILSGIDSSESIIVAGQQFARDGAQVKVQE